MGEDNDLMQSDAETVCTLSRQSRESVKLAEIRVHWAVL